VRPGRAADHSHPSSDAVMEESCSTSTHPLGHTGPVTGSLYLYLLLLAYSSSVFIFKAIFVAVLPIVYIIEQSDF
jgi:hypothetical protein